MTSHQPQHVIPRQRRPYAFTHYQVGEGTWQTRQQRVVSSWWRQRGSITHSTMTMVFSLLSLLLVAGLGFFYLQQVFGTAAQGTDIQALETKITELKEQRGTLELQGAELRSMRAVGDRVRQLNLVAADHVAYLVPVSEHVAAAR